ncbi:CRISPR-associated endonuclease Cas3-HD [Metallosphaera sp. J1]|uniref:CRISPR-associated endonuclease Cas3'' n=1 Tax=Metallosphaera javensis (ex Hofmann et al. 2022) TaxID=99938 RepID=UPI001EDE3982|nr:CRISPR-associated endonuclease Cas3'' [Metallosphaera javensis (ex Hofmann et al. 2022)]MCG3109173.1 CRISPR-associated endonuclease Cas3-HD [Metallosphaera javensis (ex Hofmann et al. 2022)]
MKPCAFSGQTLRDHSLGSVEQMMRVFRESYFRVMKRRMDFISRRLEGRYPEDYRFITGISAGQWMDLTMFLVGFHDLGKAGEFYQENFNDDCTPRRSASFKYHEVGSSLYLFRLNWKNELLRFWSVLTTMNHLNAIRSVEDLNWAEHEIRDRQGILHLKRYGWIQELDWLARRVSWAVEVTPPQDYSLGHLMEMKEWLSKMAGLRFNKGYILLLLPVIVGDNLDSSAQREKDEDSARKRRFIRALEEMYHAG